MPLASVKVRPFDIENAQAALDGVRNGFPRAYSRALNTASAGTRTDMVAVARDDYRYKAAAVRARIIVKRANFSDLNSWVRSRGSGVLLSDFLGTRQIASGLSVDVKASTGRQLIRHAFLNQARSTGKIVSMWRSVGLDGRRSPRYPVEALYGPHPEVVYNTEENWTKLREQADNRLIVAFSHQVDTVLRQYA